MHNLLYARASLNLSTGRRNVPIDLCARHIDQTWSFATGTTEDLLIMLRLVTHPAIHLG